MAVPVVCRSGVGRRQADGPRSDVVMSSVADSGREIGHGNIDATLCGHRASRQPLGLQAIGPKASIAGTLRSTVAELRAGGQSMEAY